MSEADRLFEELGYKKYDNHPEEKEEPNKWTTQDCRVIEYTQQATIKGMLYTLFIRFHIEGKVVEIGASERREGYRELGRYRNPILNMQELQAINMKVKELRLDMILMLVILNYINDCKKIGKEKLAVPLSGRLFSYFLCVPLPIFAGLILIEVL